jgi:hypothetical protein
MQIEKLEGRILLPVRPSSAAILFSNDVDAFVVRFGYFMGKPWVQVQHRSLVESLGGKFILTFSGGVDRATHL